MKKLLALVLALVMTLSLCTISNAAYSDAADVDLTEAVDVMSAVGVFEGADGKFSPKDNLTREQAAKLIAYLDLGKTVAEALPAVKVFNDVEATRWSAKYVAYCADAGYINGVGNGNFDPTGKLTGYAFGKMILCVLGYDAKIEDFIGSNWQIAVAKLMTANDIADGIEASAAATLTREQAAQYCLNALQASMVEYATKGTEVTINGAVVATGASKATAVANKATTETIADDNELQLGEKLYTKLVLDDANTDAFGRPAVKWTFKAKKVGVYADEADATYTKSTKLGVLYTDLGLSKTITATVKEDGKDAGTVDITKGDTTNSIGANGQLVECYVNSDKTVVEIVVINTYVAEVGTVTAATASADRYITLTVKTRPDSLNATFETENFAKDDLVSYTAYWNGTTYDVYSVKALEKADAGVVTQYVGAQNVGGSSVTINGTKYEYSAQAFNKDTNVSVDDEFDVYLDDYGYALYLEKTSAATNYAVVIGVGTTNAYGSSSNGATLLFPDGTQKTVTYKMASGTLTGGADHLADKEKGDVVKYTIDSEGVYKLTPATQKYANGDYADFTNGKSVISLNDGSGAANYYTTEETIFFVATYKDPSDVNKGLNYNVYTGYKSMPTVTSNVEAVSWALNSTKTSQVDAVYICAKGVEGIDGKGTYVAYNTSLKVNVDSTGSYIVAPAVVDGEVTTVKLDSARATAQSVTSNGLYKLTAITENTDGIYTVFTATKTTNFTQETASGTGDLKGEGIKAAAGAVLGIYDTTGLTDSDLIYWAYTDETTAYEVSKDYKTITAVDVDAISSDDNDLVYFSVDSNNSNKTIKTIYVVKVDNVPPTTGTVSFTTNASVTALDTETITIKKADGTNAIAPFAAATVNKTLTAGTYTYELSANDAVTYTGTFAVTVEGTTNVTLPTFYKVDADANVKYGNLSSTGAIYAVAGATVKVTALANSTALTATVVELNPSKAQTASTAAEYTFVMPANAVTPVFTPTTWYTVRCNTTSVNDLTVSVSDKYVASGSNVTINLAGIADATKTISVLNNAGTSGFTGGDGTNHNQLAVIAGNGYDADITLTVADNAVITFNVSA